MIINRTSKFLHIGIALTLALISACQVVPMSVDTSNKTDVNKLNSAIKAVSVGKVLSGVVEFPNSDTKVNIKNSDSINQSLKNFSVKASPSPVAPQPSAPAIATINDVANKATVSLIYPDNAGANLANRTIATGLTDTNGAFTITPPTSFVPVNGQVLKLQAVRRVGGDGGKDALSVRTFVVWNQSMNAWTSVSQPNLVINAKTTALTIIQEKMSGIVNPQDIIGKYNTTTTIASEITKPRDKIVHQSFRDANNEIYKTNPDPANLVPLNLTMNPSSDTNSSWSKDGTKVVFESERTQDFDIFIMNNDGTSQVNLSFATAVDREPTISPDGTKVAYRSNRTGNDEIFVVNSDGSNVNAPLNLTNDGSSNEKSPVWSPDNAKIAYTSDFTGTTNIWSSDANGLNDFNLTNSSANNYSPNWGAGFITFVSERDGNPEIYVMPSTGSTTPTRLTTNNAVDSNPVLSPDGSKIAYVSNANGAENIYVVNVSGGSATQLTTLFGNSNPSWSTDGTKITFQSNRDGNLEIYSMDAATGNNQNNQVRLTNNAFVDSSPKYGTVQEVVVTVPTINYVADLVTYLLSIGYDPIHYIGLNNITNNFVVENPTNIPFPAAPTNPTATSSDSISASFTWNYAPWAETYQVFRDGNFVAEVDRDTNIFNFTGMNNLIGNTSYIFGVKTVNGVGVSTLTATATLLTRPGMPTASVANVMLTSATLNWTAPTGGAVNYNIYRVVSGVSTLVATVPGTTNPLTYNITGLSPNTIYTYSVSGSNASGESAKSSVTFTTPNTNTGGIIGNPIPNPV